MYEETCAFTEEEMKRLEEASDEWNICREKTGQIWEFFFLMTMNMMTQTMMI